MCSLLQRSQNENKINCVPFQIDRDNVLQFRSKFETSHLPGNANSHSGLGPRRSFLGSKRQPRLVPRFAYSRQLFQELIFPERPVVPRILFQVTRWNLGGSTSRWAKPRRRICLAHCPFARIGIVRCRDILWKRPAVGHPPRRAVRNQRELDEEEVSHHSSAKIIHIPTM